jgi:exonuclease SbcC
MIIRSIDIKNFRLHADTSIDFAAEGITGIVGSNESGKSTILEALLWAFFGGDAVRGTKAGIRWFRAPERQLAKVLVSFELKGVHYAIERTETAARVMEVTDHPDGDGAFIVLAEGTAAVNKYIPELLGMSHSEFLSSFMVKQKDVMRIATMLPTERQTFIREVLGVGKLDEALKKCRSRKSALSTEHAGMRHILGDRQTYEAGLEGAKEALADAAIERGATEQAVKTALASLESADEALGFLSGAKSEEEEHVRLLESTKEDISRVGEIRAKLGVDLSAMDNMKAILAAATSEHQPVQVLQERAEEIRELGLKASAEQERLFQDRRLKVNSHNEAKADAIGKAATVQRTIDVIEGMGADAPCPTCTVPLDANYEPVLKSLKAEHAGFIAIRDTAAGDVNILSVQGVDEHEANAQAEAYLADLHDHNLTLEAAIKRDNQLSEIRGKVERIDEIKAELAKCDALLKVSVLILKDTEELRKRLAFSQEGFRTATQNAGNARAKHQEATVAGAKADAMVEAKDDSLEIAQTALNDYDEKAGEVETMAADLLIHEKAAARLADFRTSVASLIRPELEELMSGFVHLLTDGRHEAVELNEDFEAVLHESGIAVEVVSGGCEDIAALAMRLSISHMIAERAGHPLSLLWLDEPFGSQDENRRGNILTLLRRLKDVFTQVVVISHIGETRDAADHIIELEHDELEGRSRVVA